VSRLDVVEQRNRKSIEGRKSLQSVSCGGTRREREGQGEHYAAVVECVPFPISLSGLGQTAEQRSCFKFGRLCLMAACDVQTSLYTPVVL